MKNTSIIILIITTFILLLLSSCQSYMFVDAQKAIEPIPSIIKPTDSYSKMKQVEESVREEPEVLEETITNEIIEEKTIELKEEKESNLLTTALVPLPAFVMDGDIKIIAQTVEQENLDIVAFTGEREVLEKMREYLSYEVEIVDNNTLLATNLQLEERQSPYHIFTYSDNISIALSVLDIREKSYYYEALDGQEVPSVLLKEKMLDEVTRYTTALSNIPTIVFASLYESFDSSLLSSYDVIDAYEVSHHISQIENDSTLRIQDGKDHIELRSDYIFTYNLLPLDTATIDISIAQTRKVPSEQRSAISGTFFVQ